MKADVNLDIGQKTFASGLLPELITWEGHKKAGPLLVATDHRGR